MSLEALVQSLEDLSEYKRTHKIEDYKPYPFQKAFHGATRGSICEAGHYKLEDDEIASERILVSANQIGKTTCAAHEVYYHASGHYPEWWEGVKFDKPVTILVAGKRNETTRDTIQFELCGDPFDESAWGTGSIPLDELGKPTRKAGVPQALSAVLVQHKSGKWSKIRFMAFEQGADAFMGVKYDLAWLDEEPPQDILSQVKRSQLAKKRNLIMITFTPEEGMTEVVTQVLEEPKDWQAVIHATWDDAPHMTPERREELLEQFPEHEREMRSKGIPIMGMGLVYPVMDDELMCDSFPIPRHFYRISGIDFGVDHPFAYVSIAYDMDRDKIYVIDCFKERRALISTNVSNIRHRTEQWIPIVWPHDGMKEDPKSGKTLRNLYYEEGLTQLMDDHFTNPPGPGEVEGKGGIGVEAGLMDVLERMRTGRFKVFRELEDWFIEKRQYHRKVVNGRSVINKVKDDLMDATRIATMSIRHAETPPLPVQRHVHRPRAQNW